jgi:Mrp family chromosome partitioning ATPase
VALKLACSLARARQRVLVVDCDLTNPGIARALGIRCEVGLMEALRGGLPASAASTRIRPHGFSVVPVRRPVHNRVELLAAPAFWKMLKSFDRHYDFVLFDSPALETLGDPTLLVRFTDTTLLVVEAGKTGSAELARAMTSFTQDDLLGVVLNRTGNG